MASCPDRLEDQVSRGLCSSVLEWSILIETFDSLYNLALLKLLHYIVAPANTGAMRRIQL